jgi:hypothetical protein
MILKDSQVGEFRDYFERSGGKGMKMTIFVMRTEPSSLIKAP